MIIYIYIYMYLNKIFLEETMISYIWLWIIWLWIDSDTQPMGVIHWYSDTQTNEGYSLVFRYPNQCGLFIGTLIPSQWGLFIDILIPKPMGIIHWYLIPSQLGLFIGILIPKLKGVIHWYSDTQTNEGYSLVFWCPVTGI